jgi:hypothetical protein
VSGRSLRRGNWSVQEFERLRYLLPRRGVVATAALLRRSPESVQRKAALLLRVPARRGDWTAGDDAMLRDAWGALDLRLLGLMIGRPPIDVRRRAELLRQQRRTGGWSRAERLVLKDLYPTRADTDLEVCLSRPLGEIAAMAERMCLAKDKRFLARRAGRPGSRIAVTGELPPEFTPLPVRMPRWTAEQEQSLRELYADRDNLEVAKALGRTVTSVANKAHQLGLGKGAALLADIGRRNVQCRYGAAEPSGDAAAGA